MSYDLIDIVSTNNKLSKRKAAEKISYCIEKASNEFDITVGSIIVDMYGILNNSYDELCEYLDPDYCDVSILCTAYNDTCQPIFIKDYKLINDDPDGYINELDTAELKRLMDTASYLYYNIGDSGLDDNSFDAIQYHLYKRLKKEGIIIEEIGAIPIKKLQKDLPFPLASLDKIKPEQKEYIDFVNNAPAQGIIWSDKLDGVSALVIYNNGNPIELYTRGNGVIGGDISYLLEYIDLPKNIEHQTLLAVRGELVITRNNFRHKYKELYSNARSFIVSMVNRSSVIPSVVDIDFVAYEVVSYGNKQDHLVINPKQDLLFLEETTFKTVTHGVFDSNTLMLDITLQYKERRDESIYDIDGLVLDYNFVRKVVTIARNPEFKKAFKMIFEEQKRWSFIEDVEWDISRHGRYNPVAIFKPIYISNTRMTRATAHNAAHVRDWNLSNGTKVLIVRSGDIIPQIKDVVVNFDKEAIYPNDDYEWHWSNKDIILNSIDDNPRVKQKRILHFLQVIEAKGVGEKTVEKMFSKGFTDIKSIVNASIAELMTVPGIGKVMANKIKSGLNYAITNMPIDRFLAAFTVTDFKVSRKLVKEVFRAFPFIMDKDYSSIQLKEILSKKKIKGIGPKRNEMIAEQFPIFRYMLFELDSEGIAVAIENQRKLAEKLKREGYNKMIENKSFVLSGFQNTPYYLEDFIYNNMGTVESSVVSGTNMLIAATNTTITTKVLTAKEFNIPIYTLSEFKEKIMDA